MKTIPKHLVTVLPRVRSNSVSSPRLYSSASLSLFDSSTPPPSRPVLSSNRLCIEGKPAEVEGSQNSQHHSHSHPPFSLALAQPQSSSGQTLANTNPQGQYALFPYSSLTQPGYAHAHAQQTAQETHTHPRPKRQRLKYQLDVGAYGIPKRCRTTPTSRRHHSTSAHQYNSTDDVALSVQVGEDAYFVRDNAMGVADGVGGWSKSHSTRPASTPSALFARRLMHYCSAEVEFASKPSEVPAASTSPSPTAPSPIPHKFQTGSGSRLHPPSRPHFSFTHHLRPRPPPPSSTPAASPAWKWSESPMSSSLPASFSFHDVFNHPTTPPPPTSRDHHHATPSSYPSEEYSAAEWEYDDASDLEQDLEDSLEELSEGIDVLQILERAYDKTLKVHVVPGSESQPQTPSTPPPRTNVVSTAPSSTTSAPTQGEAKPLLAGSSTALLAVLDHPPRTSHVSSSSSSNPATTLKNTASAPITVTSSITTTPVPNSSSATSPSSLSSLHSFSSSSAPRTAPTASATIAADHPNAALNAPKANTSKAAQTPLKASTATATATATASSASPVSSSPTTKAAPAAASELADGDGVPESTPVECELEECEGEYDAVIKIAHVGDCMGMLVRGEEMVWRSEEMWWDVRCLLTEKPELSFTHRFYPVAQFNTPVQLGPSTQETVTPRNSAMVITIPVKADDILILASDGLSDNLWDEDVLDEVVRFKKSFLDFSSSSDSSASSPAPSENKTSSLDPTENDSGYSSSSSTEEPSTPSGTPTPTPNETSTTPLKRKTLAGMLSEALCSRARHVSERKASYHKSTLVDVDEVPFARRAREAGRRFGGGGKNDDISVVVAVISPRAK
ncbi:hypothetical protein D9756_010505 [Leucocoprinus leucothites]|uniref:PPM-type phosphatase domain-containing protein n=1 Tax=Leucocoprinus leucothites TaxID=201217 RepID=A0A8H5FT95_9AGAR|nr:hypothetical protein D9756_010505 [Leucoagaricus leucothites]